MLPVDKFLASHRSVRHPALLLVTWSMRIVPRLNVARLASKTTMCHALNVLGVRRTSQIILNFKRSWILVVLCSANGIAIPKLTFPGQDPNRQLSTSAIPSSTSGAASGTGGGSSTSISHSTISETSVITAVSSQTSASTSISSISRSTITSLAPASSTSVTERSSAAASAITTPASSASTTSAASGTAPAPAGTADSVVALESDMLWMVPALVAFFFSV
ncbi:hypothetical protein ARMGADRAFT_235547 [Armillaria gallica]|uniref:Uncharacterized protein n=1 Tax=Armillaria gallica TaxID=47427 RepID=A0A2H3E6M3_ARMGA|nr:hypothetical protein ARMGADRAFT_235547 [Armillaria gallica]